MTVAVKVNDVHYVYRRQGKPDVIANNGLNFTVNQGEIFGLLGHNGAGKTTLVMQLIGLLTPVQGQIRIDGLNVSQNPQAIKSLVGYLPQTQTPLRYVSVRQALHFTGRLRGLREAETQNQVDWLLAALELDKFATSDLNKLSGGMLRLTNFAMSLMGSPKVIILDEPTNNLDPQSRRLMWDLIRRMNVERGLTCLLVTHNIAEAESVMHRVVVMQNGQITAQGTPGEIKQHVSETVQLDFWLKYLDRVPQTIEVRLPGALEHIRERHYRLQIIDGI